MDKNIADILSKAMRFCSTKEVCVSDINKKLISWGIIESEINIIIEKLIDEDFINEMRYAKAFTLDKFKFNNWGKQKIRFELRKKEIPQSYINIATKKIKQELYLQKAEKLFIEKLHKIKESNNLKKKQKIFSYMSTKGFETEIIYQIADRYFQND